MTWDVSTDTVEVEIDMATETPIAADWGEIGGTLSDQTDLQTALNAKLSDAPTDNKQYARKNGAWAEVEEGSIDHTQLTNRDAANQHPISAIQGLQTALDGKGTYSKPASGIPKADMASDVQTSLGKADTAIQEHQSLADYATKAWVEAKGYITSLAGYATEAWVTAKNYATQSWVDGKGYLTQHQSLAAYRTASEQDAIHDSTKQDTLTTAQLAAANSGITSADKTKLDGIATSATNTSVSATGTATDEVQYITINGVEKKLAGGGGGGIWGQITGNLNDQQDLHNALSAKQDGLTAGSGISIIDNIISAIIATQGNAMFSFDVSNDNLYLNATDTALTEFTFSIDANGNLIMEYEEV